MILATLSALPPQEGTVVVAVPPEAFGMLDLFDGGFMVYPLIACAALVVSLGAWNTWSLSRPGARPDPILRTRIDAVLFWGAFSVVIGVLGTVVGVMVTAQSIGMAGSVHATLVWGGIRVALITTVLGLLVLALAALIWIGLRLGYAAMEDRAAPA